MPPADSFLTSRRALLAQALSGAGAAALSQRAAGTATGAATAAATTNVVRDEARPEHARLLRLFSQAHARLDGRPAFWVARGREYGFVKGRFEQIYERHIVSATRAVEADGGGLKASYCEAAYATAAGETAFRRELTSPFTGQSFPNPLIRPLKMTWDVSPAGLISARVDTPTVHSRYDGRIETQLGPAGDTAIDCLVQIQVHRGEELLALSELGPYEPDWHAEHDGFVPAHRLVTVYRPLPANIAGGEAGVMLGAHASRKHASIDSVRGALSATESGMFRDWFESWETMLAASEDFLMSAPR